MSDTCKPPPRRGYRGFLREGTGDRLWWDWIKPKGPKGVFFLLCVGACLTNGLGSVRPNLLGLNRIPVRYPLDGATGAFYVKGPVTGYGGLESSLKVLKVLFPD